jgi:hypothetical protein
MAAENVIGRQFYEGLGGWKDGRLGQAYDLVREVLTDRGEKSWQHPLLASIESLDDEEQS